MKRFGAIILLFSLLIYTGAMAKELIQIKIASDPPIVITVDVEEKQVPIEYKVSTTIKPAISNTRIYTHVNERMGVK